MRLVLGLCGLVIDFASVWLLGLVVGFNDIDGRVERIASRILDKPTAIGERRRPERVGGTDSLPSP